MHAAAPRPENCPHVYTRGFTLVEILVVLAIIGLIMGGVAVMANSVIVGARVDVANQRATGLLQAVEMYRVSHAGECPPELETLRRRKMIRKAPEDPWGRPFELDCEGRDDARIRSAGPDGEFGNEDDIRSGGAPSDKP